MQHGVRAAGEITVCGEYEILRDVNVAEDVVHDALGMAGPLHTSDPCWFVVRLLLILRILPIAEAHQGGLRSEKLLAKPW